MTKLSIAGNKAYVMDFINTLAKVEEDKFLNQCTGENRIEKNPTIYGYQSIHKVGNHKVLLTFNSYTNSEGGRDDELVSVKVL